MTIITLFCKPSIGRDYPSNYILLSLFTLFTSYMVGIATVYYNTKSVYIAFAITSSITIMLTIYAWQTKYDFTDKGGYLLAVLTGLIITGILNIFIQNSVLQLICSGIGAILFSCYIVYDTQLIVGGKHRKYSYDEKDYVFAAITLYLDIINLFLYMLDLVGGRRR
jgi:protein lifeguard